MIANSGRSIEVGTRPDKVTVITPPAGAHLFGLRGSYGPDCAAPAVQLVWGTETCNKKVGTCVSCFFWGGDELARFRECARAAGVGGRPRAVGGVWTARLMDSHP